MAKALGKRNGVVSTHLAGTDGVSLEIARWVKILTELGGEHLTQLQLASTTL